MKHLLILMFATALTFVACEKVINVNLNTANPKLVVDAIITDDSTRSPVVKLSMTSSYFGANTFPTVSGANVMIADNVGNSETLKESSVAGTYLSTKLKGTPGRTYTLQISTGGKSYAAQSTMPAKIPIDSLNVDSTTSERGGFGRGGGFATNKLSYNVICAFKDPPFFGHYYQITFFVKDSATAGRFINPDSTIHRLYSDKYIDNNEVDFTFRGQKFVVGDSVTAELNCIDQPTYNFYNTLNNITNGGGGPGSTAPANPTTNLIGGALGYFTAYTVSKKSVKVK